MTHALDISLTVPSKEHMHEPKYTAAPPLVLGVDKNNMQSHIWTIINKL